MSEWAIEKKVKLSNRHSVVITGGPGGFCCEWEPLPQPNSLTPKEIRRYKRARNALVAEMSERMGGSVLIVET